MINFSAILYFDYTNIDQGADVLGLKTFSLSMGLRFFSGLLLLSCLSACSPPSDDVIRIVGSSTVYPFSRTVAERYAIKSGARAPVIEVTGTGAGFKRFCNGPGAADISNASRPVKKSEVELCAENGIEELVEFTLGYDGVVAAIAPDNPLKSLTLEQFYLGLARDIPGPSGGFVPNPYKRWSEVDPSLPDFPILVHGPPPTSGTRDAFVELVMQVGATRLPEMAELKKRDKHTFEARAGAIREDGLWIDEGENDNAIIQIIRQSDHAVGVFGFSFFDQNRDLVKGVALGGVEPSARNIADQSYPLARSLFFYADSVTLRARPDVREYVQEFLSEAAIGEFGYLAEKGLIPLSPRQRIEMRAKLYAFSSRDGSVETAGATL